MKKLFGVIAVLALLGAGCGFGGDKAPSGDAYGNNAPKPTTPKPTESTPTDTTPKPVDTSPEPSGEIVSLNAATTDDTWKTYSSANLGFSFMWPTKGRYAPEWEVKVFDQKDPMVAGGCYMYAESKRDEAKMVKVGEQVFCHTSALDPGAGQFYFLDSYATMIGTRVVVIAFTKHTVNAANLDCKGFQYSTSGSACIEFVQAEHLKALDGIVGTFKLNAE